MNKQDFKEALQARKEDILKAMDEYMKEVLLPEASKSDSLGNASVNVYEDSLPEDITLHQAESYLKGNGFDVTFVNAVSDDVYLIVGWD